MIEGLGAGPIGLDTAPFIYFMERHPTYAPLLRQLFVAADTGSVELVTSEVTLLEVLVAPYRAGALALADRYEALLTRGRGVRMVPLARPILRAAAQLRARYGIRAPDALQLAAALGAGCSAFVTNDRRLPDLPGLKVVQLAELS